MNDQESRLGVGRNLLEVRPQHPHGQDHADARRLPGSRRNGPARSRIGQSRISAEGTTRRPHRRGAEFRLLLGKGDRSQGHPGDGGQRSLGGVLRADLFAGTATRSVFRCSKFPESMSWWKQKTACAWTSGKGSSRISHQANPCEPRRLPSFCWRCSRPAA